MPESLAKSASKARLRLDARARNAALDLPALSAILAGRLTLLPEFSKAQNILLYLCMTNEICVDDLAIGYATKNWFAPRCAELRRLAIHRYQPDTTAMRIGRYGIREPDPDDTAECDPLSLDMVIIPGCLFTEACDRLGQGGGYYDRLLPRLRPECRRIAIAPDAAIVTSLPLEPWDQPLDVIVTESRIIRRQV